MIFNIALESLKFSFLQMILNVLYSLEKLKTLEFIVNTELNILFNWLTANKRTLQNFVIFRQYQKRLNFLPQINIFDNEENMNVSLEQISWVIYIE